MSRKTTTSCRSLTLLSGRLGVPQREAGAGALPPVHAVRRRHGRRGLAGGGRGNLHDCLRLLEALGIKGGHYAIRVNNRKVLDGVMESIGLGGEANAGRRLTVRRAATFDRLGVEGVRLLRGTGVGREPRLHESRRPGWGLSIGAAGRTAPPVQIWRSGPGDTSPNRSMSSARSQPRGIDRTRAAMDGWREPQRSGRASRLRQIGTFDRAQAMLLTASSSIPRWSGASHITPARSSRPN